MKALKTLWLTCLILGLSGVAFAKPDGRQIRPSVQKYYKARGLSTNIQVHAVRPSQSGKSTQVAVVTRNSGTVRLFNVTQKSSKVSATRTGLVKQSTGRGLANLRFHREKGPRKGTFSGVNSSGLSTTGKTYKFTSATDRKGKNAERAYVKLVGGKVFQQDR